MLNVSDLKQNKIKLLSSKTMLESSVFKSHPKISNNLKEIILDTINDKYNKKLFDLLQKPDRRIFTKLINTLKIPIDMDNNDDADENTQFQILLGEFEAGNTSIEVKNSLKRHIRLAIQDKRISKVDGLELLLDLK